MNIAILTAAGIGSRFNSNLPKQYLKINEKEIIEYTLLKFYSFNFDHIILISSKDYLKKNFNRISELNLNHVHVVEGGLSNMESVKIGLRYCQNVLKITEFDNLTIHDGVRPNVSLDLISKSISNCNKYGNAVPCLPVREGILFKHNSELSYTGYDRESLVITQTPQTYKWNLVKVLLQKDVSQDCSPSDALSKLGVKLHFIEGEVNNIKLTYQIDFELLKLLL